MTQHLLSLHNRLGPLLPLVLAVLFGHWHGPGALEWTMTLAEFAAAGLLIAASAPESWVSRMLSAPPLVAIGILSY